MQRADLEALDQDRGVGAGQAVAVQCGDQGVLHRQADPGEIGWVFQLRRDADDAAGAGGLLAGEGHDFVEGQDGLLIVPGRVARTQLGQALAGA
ncbi:hypothetical protein D3C75_1067910 [compost metagenome]